MIFWWVLHERLLIISSGPSKDREDLEAFEKQLLDTLQDKYIHQIDLGPIHLSDASIDTFIEIICRNSLNLKSLALGRHLVSNKHQDATEWPMSKTPHIAARLMKHYRGSLDTLNFHVNLFAENAKGVGLPIYDAGEPITFTKLEQVVFRTPINADTPTADQQLALARFVRDLTRLVRVSPNLKSVTIRGVYALSVSIPWSAFFDSAAKLHTLVFRDCYFYRNIDEIMVTAFKKIAALGQMNLRHLTWEYVSTGEYPDLTAHLLAAPGVRLEDVLLGSRMRINIPSIVDAVYASNLKVQFIDDVDLSMHGDDTKKVEFLRNMRLKVWIEGEALKVLTVMRVLAPWVQNGVLPVELVQHLLTFLPEMHLLSDRQVSAIVKYATELQSNESKP